MQPPPPPQIILTLAAALDAAGSFHRPAALALAPDRIVALDSPARILPLAAPSTRIIHHPTLLLLPALVNAHAHLDLTHLGPQPYQGDFTQWLGEITALRRDHGVDSIRDSVLSGLQQSLQAGVGFVGDIAGTPPAAAARLSAPASCNLPGVSFLEVIGFGRGQIPAYARLTAALASLPPAAIPQLAPGISPHAPYTVDLPLYHALARLALERNLPFTTHLAESPAELQYLLDHTGPIVERRRALGKWDSTCQPPGLHPVDALQQLILPCPPEGWSLVHCNLLSPRHISLLAASGAVVTYCPRASAYFQLPADQPHPYRELLAAGVPVALGTDSILCQPPDEPQPYSILAQMRFLYRRDRTDPLTLLRMATTFGLRALHLPPTLATLLPSQGSPQRFLTVPIDPADPTSPLAQALTHSHPAQTLTPFQI